MEARAEVDALISVVEDRNRRRVERIRGVVFLGAVMVLAWWTSDESVRDSFLRP